MTSPRPSDVRRAGRAGFTLVELLAVIAIIGVMVAVMVPSFSQMGRGAKVTTAVSQLKTVMSLARQHAITKREVTYVVFPHGDNALYTSASDVAKAYRSYNVYGARSGYLREWVHLPDGVVFVPSGQGTTDSKNFFQVGLTNQIPFPSNGSTPKGVIVAAFKADGQLVLGNGSGRYAIYLSEGWLDATNVPVGVPTYKPGTKMLFSLELFGITGRFKINDHSS